MKIIVLAGGLSPERNVSLSSGAKVANALIENGHDVMVFDIYLGKQNEYFVPIYHNKKEEFQYKFDVTSEEPDLDELKKIKKDNYLVDKDIITYCESADKVFLALHGSTGENGKLQSLLDIYNIKYTSTYPLGSMLSMHKDIAKRLMKQSEVLTPNWKYINTNETYNLDGIMYPCVIKPCSNGSSIGTTIVNNETELMGAFDKAKVYESEIIIEEKIEGREFTVAIIKGRVLPIIEIKPLSGFYDYKNKYKSGATIEECPANIPNDIKQNLESIALKVHNILHLGTYSRIDFLMDNNNRIYCLEANTLPGMTTSSLFPLAAKEAGITYNDLCEMIIRD